MYVLPNRAKKNFVRENIYYIVIYIEVFWMLFPEKRTKMYAVKLNMTQKTTI
jgi:phage anti-repressor protein